MRRRHRVTDIAAQAGLSRATVDRVLHGRPGVRPETVTQVERALEELDRQRAQVELSGRALILDLVMQAPARFAVASQQALEAELRSLRPAVVRVRSHLSEDSDPDAAAAALDEVRRRGSHGVVLKAPDDPRVAAAVDRLVGVGRPGRHLRHRRLGQSPLGVRRGGQPRGGRDGGVPGDAVGGDRPGTCS